MALPFLQRVGTSISNFLNPSGLNPSETTGQQPQQPPSIGRTIRGILSSAGQQIQQVPQRISDMFQPTVSPLPDEPNLRVMFTTPTPTPTQAPLPTPTPTRAPIPQGQPGRNPATANVVTDADVTFAIDQASRKYRIPRELLFDIAYGESSLDPRKIGPTGDYGLFQFQDPSWQDVLKYRNVPGSTLEIPNEDYFDPNTAALMAAYLISKGQLGRWNASFGGWSPYYTDEELLPYYSQTPMEKRPERMRR